MEGFLCPLCWIGEQTSEMQGSLSPYHAILGGCHSTPIIASNPTSLEILIESGIMLLINTSEADLVVRKLVGIIRQVFSSVDVTSWLHLLVDRDTRYM